MVANEITVIDSYRAGRNAYGASASGGLIAIEFAVFQSQSGRAVLDQDCSVGGVAVGLCEEDVTYRDAGICLGPKRAGSRTVCADEGCFVFTGNRALQSKGYTAVKFGLDIVPEGEFLRPKFPRRS